MLEACDHWIILYKLYDAKLQKYIHLLTKGELTETSRDYIFSLNVNALKT